jgi:hypothetical protein
MAWLKLYEEKLAVRICYQVDLSLFLYFDPIVVVLCLTSHKQQDGCVVDSNNIQTTPYLSWLNMPL